MRWIVIVCAAGNICYLQITERINMTIEVKSEGIQKITVEFKWTEWYSNLDFLTYGCLSYSFIAVTWHRSPGNLKMKAIRWRLAGWTTLGNWAPIVLSFVVYLMNFCSKQFLGTKPEEHSHWMTETIIISLKCLWLRFLDL